MRRREVRRASRFKGLHCQSATSRVFDDKELFREVSKQIARKRVVVRFLYSAVQYLCLLRRGYRVDFVFLPNWVPSRFTNRR